MLVTKLRVRLNHHGLRTYSSTKLPGKIQAFVDRAVELCNPTSGVHICDGSEGERKILVDTLICSGGMKALGKYCNSYLMRTDPRDACTPPKNNLLCTVDPFQAVPETQKGVKSTLGNWLDLQEARDKVKERFCQCMKGRKMYVVPYCLGPLGSKFAVYGVEVTDSAYVAIALGTMTRMGSGPLECIRQAGNVIMGLHSSGRPVVASPDDLVSWPCDPERMAVYHMMDDYEIYSYGSGYKYNSVQCLKSASLRIASWMGKQEGWMAEHMMVMGLEPEGAQKRYILVCMPDGQGKQAFAMLQPAIGTTKVSLVSDDLAFLKIDPCSGSLVATNPLKGILAHTARLTEETDPTLFDVVFKNALFTNTAETGDGGVWWDTIPVDSCVDICDWRGNSWKPECAKTTAAHRDSHVMIPIEGVPCLDCAWEDSSGVPISAILIGSRRSKGVPLVYQAHSWAQAVLMGATLKNEEKPNQSAVNDPFAMRRFFGYNASHYFENWIKTGNANGLKPPQMFFCNLFLKDEQSGCQGELLWPGGGHNVRILDWILKRLEKCPESGVSTPIGTVPRKGALNLFGMDPCPPFDKLVKVDPECWLEEVAQMKDFFKSQMPKDTPYRIQEEIRKLEKKLKDSREDGC